MLNDIGEDTLFRTFVMAVDDTLTQPQDFAQLIDLTRNSGETFTAMMVGRAAAGKGVILPERMYPVMATPQVSGAPELGLHPGHHPPGIELRPARTLAAPTPAA